MSDDAFHVLLSGRFDAEERGEWRRCLRAAAPECVWWTDEDGDAPRDLIAAAVVANPAPGALAGLPRLRLVQSLWAGVEGLLADRSLPAGVPLARMVDPAMNAAMAETALWATLSLQRRFFDYAAQQTAGTWRALPQRRAAELCVLVLGLGQMGQAVVSRLQSLGYTVRAWCATPGARAVPQGVTVHAGATALPQALADVDVVINLLPLTAATRGLLDARFFAALPRAASVVNLARGGHVVDDDLLAALDSGHVDRAVLDVFHHEPLPAAHRYWTHPRVTLLPHAAALTDRASAAGVVVANLRALRDGKALAHQVDRVRGY